MDKPLFNLIALKEAEYFISSLPEKVQEKVLFNIRKVRFGVKDINLFKKLGDSEIWEFRTLYQDIRVLRIACSPFGIRTEKRS